jgi:ABC-type uncharacterized transport system ATPase subunit
MSSTPSSDTGAVGAGFKPAPTGVASAPAVELIGIEKRFGPVRANRDVSVTVARGSIHGIVGENGAGKSTLMSILYGYYQADAGEIRIGGQHLTIRNSHDAIAAGIGMVHQHFMLVDDFSVLENVVLGVEGGALLKDGLGKARAALKELGDTYGLEVDPDALIHDLPVGLQQRVEIIKALYRGAEILILDEPTGVLTPQEADQLFVMLKRFREQGKTVILITHKLREIMAITDRVTVMRQGAVVDTVDTAGTSREQLAEMMVGRKVLLRTAAFSGGNQQKIVLAREMDRDPALLLVGQPTRGVDIGAIEFIHRRLVAMRDAGKAILLVSVELDEILGLADRILVMFDGRIVGELPRAEATEARLGLLMAGVEGRA